MPLTLGLRPKLQFKATGTAAEISARIHKARSNYPVTALDNYLVVTIPETRSHYWSPQLQVELEDGDEGTVHVSGLVTPMPAVWTMFAGFYITILVMGFFGLMFGMAQRQIGAEPAWGLWSLPVSIILLALVYAAAAIGQRIGRAQTEELVAFLRSAIEPK